MTIRKLILSLALPVLVMSCGPNLKHISEVEIRDSIVYDNGNPYTGDVWSDDERLFSLTTTGGVIVNCRVFHINDSLAIEILNDSTVKYYDEVGDTIPEDTFRLRYKDLCATLPELVKIIKQ